MDNSFEPRAGRAREAMLSIEQMDAEIRREHARCVFLINSIAELHKVRSPTLDEPLTIDEVLCLPELGGKLYQNRPPVPSSSFKESTIRNAIRTGALGRYRPNTKNIFISRLMIREWLETCQ